MTDFTPKTPSLFVIEVWSAPNPEHASRPIENRVADGEKMRDEILAQMNKHYDNHLHWRVGYRELKR